MNKQNLEKIKDEALNFAYEQDDFFDWEYAILFKDGSVEFEKLPSASDWEKTGWTEVGKIEGLGSDGIRIRIETEGEILYDEKGYFNLPDPPEDLEEPEELIDHSQSHSKEENFFRN
ncbi:hypothetical protein ACNF40_02970 [Cuniculiplasma sp. SKW4]|uniref:hypothetical protein n=1 Tax=Cuniculiplasma sp. SKW4 TaxID=3400171 RepID=UPI003FD25312